MKPSFFQAATLEKIREQINRVNVYKVNSSRTEADKIIDKIILKR